MFNRVDASFRRGNNAISAVSMRGDFDAMAMRLIGDGFHFLEGHLLRANGVFKGENACRRADLDDLGAMLDLIARGANETVRAVGDASRIVSLQNTRAIAGRVAMPARDAQSIPGRNDMRAIHFSCFYGFRKSDVDKIGRAHFANRRKAGEQRFLRVHRRVIGEVRSREPDVRRIPAWFNAQRQMRVRIHQSWQEGDAAEIYYSAFRDR